VAGMVSISKGTDPGYYTQAAKGPEYYSAGAGIDGVEPEGIWTGIGCPDLGLVIGMPVDKGVFLRLFGEHADPRDGRRLGRAVLTYKRDWQQIYQTLLQAEPGATAERRAELQSLAQDQAVPWRRIYQGLLAAELEATAERRAELKTQAMALVRQAVPYFDATFSPSKDVSVLHASFMAASIRASGRVTRGGGAAAGAGGCGVGGGDGGQPGHARSPAGARGVHPVGVTRAEGRAGQHRAVGGCAPVRGGEFPAAHLPQRRSAVACAQHDPQLRPA
jgi:hypothetical protein